MIVDLSSLSWTQRLPSFKHLLPDLRVSIWLIDPNDK